MEGPEKVPAEIPVTCSKCGWESREARKFCPRCGFPYASVFKPSASTLQSIEPAIKTCAALFCVNLLFLLRKILPEGAHLHIEVVVSALFYLIVLVAIHPFRSKILFLGRKFFNKPYPPLKMVSLALMTAAGILVYFEALEAVGMPTVNFLEKGDSGTPKAAWVFISAVLLAPVFEEIYFRGYLFRKFRLLLEPRETIILQGLLFGIIHLNPAAYISHTMMGILFGYFRYRTNSLLPGILFHALWNFSVIATEYSRLAEGWAMQR